jgi:hypothetical protein
MTKPLKQRSTNDCAIAALAMFLNETYKNTKNLVDFHHAKNEIEDFEGLTCNQLVEVSEMVKEKIKIWYSPKHCRKSIKKKLQGRRAILVVPAMGYSPFENMWHAIYWDGKYIYDPVSSNTSMRYGRNGKRAFDKMAAACVWLEEDLNDSVEVI